MIKKLFLFLLIIVIFILIFIFPKKITNNKPDNEAVNNLIENNMTNDIKLTLTSESFKNNELIPKQYTCDGKNISPSLIISNLPAGTKSLALIVDDPDATVGNWVHWLLWNISPEILLINEGTFPSGSIQGLTDFKSNKYGGPCPPSGTHRYFFKLYALDIVLNLEKNNKKSDLDDAMDGHILEKTELIGLYSRK